LTPLLDVIEWAEWIGYAALAVVTFRLWRRHRSVAAAWAAATFGSLALVVVVAAAYGPNPKHISEVVTKVLIAVIVLFPYALFRFAATFIKPSRTMHTIAAIGVAIVVVWTFLLPKFPTDPATRPTGVFLVYLVALIALWTALSLPVGILLWLRGQGQPTLPRRRMRLLALATLGLNLSIVISGAAGNANRAVSQAITQLIGLGSAVAFYLAFAPPGPLRAWWRRSEEASLQRAAVGVSAATTLDEVTTGLLPRIAPLFGGHGAVLIGKQHGIIGSHGMTPDETAAIDTLIRTDAVERAGTDLITLPLRNGWIAVSASVYTPFFGNEEIERLRNIGAFIDLAIDRADLFEAERRARLEIERASDELESFLYSVSHDLKSPLVSLSGYIGYLLEDYGDAIGTEGRQYVERMTANASYMEDLIQDLLELSRIGRMQTEVADVDLGELVHDIAEGIRSSHPEATIDVSELPFLSINPSRARQLFTNLIENAVRHGGRSDIRVFVGSHREADGSTVLSVIDNGEGIPADYRERVFRVFERLQPDAGEGTGIGLSICRKIVDSLGGRIWVADAADGTDIEIALPADVVRSRKMEVSV
jgi:signal transduction histidine kinase